VRRARLVVLSLALGSAAPAAGQDVRQALLVAEDGRSRKPADYEPLVRGLAASDPAVVVEAVRGLGRFERGSLAPTVLPLLHDARPPVRAAAAHALGQLGQDTSNVEVIAAALRQAAAGEADPAVLGALARSLGRLPYRRTEDAGAARDLLRSLVNRPGPVVLLQEVTRAIEALGRKGGRSLPRDPELVTRLRTLAELTSTSPESARSTAAIRRAALFALARPGDANRATIATALADREAEVRRIGALILQDSATVEGKAALVSAALADPAPMVRLEALRAWSRHFQRTDCGPVIRAMRDRVTIVSLEAIDLLGTGCAEPEVVSRTLWPAVDSLASNPRGEIGTIARWHRGAHALVALARVDPNRARGVLARMGSNALWPVRMYAARAAGIVGDGDRLLVLAEDPNDNVREAAVDGLTRIRGAGVGYVYLAQLARDDHQLLITTARALAGTTERIRAFSGLLGALARLSDQRNETSRDARLALLDRLAEFDRPGRVDSLKPLLTDYDPVVAARVAAILTQWTGQPWTPDPRPLPPPVFQAAELDRLRGAKLRITMSPVSGGGSFDVALFPDQAPVTVLRVARLTRQGFYDGRTFHRVVPNFVIQGGSPKANEYTGDGSYLRDELGPDSHERGTLGISTRGRDTGDAQIFVNLVENLRLDFEYTVWGAVVRGMDLVDEILEDDVIERVDVVR
jgi:cyclophilin family peptidyl-prolyl cis-trans isomerase/HEAT repeat protein